MDRLRELIEQDQWAELLQDAQQVADHAKHSDIEVLAFSRKEALKKAADIFGIDSSHLICEELIKGNSGFLGWFKIPNQYLISIKPEILSSMKKKNDYTQNNELAQNKNGTFRLIMRKNGLELVVYPPKGLGKPVYAKDIEAELERRNIENINNNLIQKALKSPEETLIIAPYIKSEQDATFSISTDKNDMTAFLSISNPGNKGRIPEKNEIIDGLKKIGVTHGINELAVTEALDNELYQIPIPIAEGTPVQNGINAYIEYSFPVGEDRIKYAVRPDGSVDFKELNIIHNVHKGDVVAVMHPPTNGTNGMTLSGEIIQATPGKELAWNVGENITLSKDGLEAIAATTGQVYLKNNQLCVDPAFEVAGDVDLSIGNIDFVGNIIIKGNVNDGFSIHSGGNIEIHGHVGKCVIHAEGDIIAHKGIQGKDEAHIECEGSLYAKFIERCHLSVGQNIVISDSILHSKVICQKNIIVLGGKKSIIAGGILQAKQRIYAKQIGAESYIETQIEAGYSAQLLHELEKMHLFVKEKEKQYNIMKAEINGLSSKLPPQKVHQLEQNLFALKKQQDKGIQAIESINEQIRLNHSEAMISVEKKIMPGVKLTIGDAHLDISIPQNSGSFVKKDHKIIMKPYEAPPLLQSQTKK